MDCRKCGACCIAPSITTAIPNMPYGKPAGARCANLSDRNECVLYGKATRPAFCIGWQHAGGMRTGLQRGDDLYRHLGTGHRLKNRPPTPRATQENALSPAWSA